ncbi:hypothetical protein [Bradyrhizobium genosp. P]|uniref:hypothetical protein n=1 Tax=Bradyrhizobium genosp. P TaxID=83641 RepID=UPI003CEA72C9
MYARRIRPFTTDDHRGGGEKQHNARRDDTLVQHDETADERRRYSNDFGPALDFGAALLLFDESFDAYAVVSVTNTTNDGHPPGDKARPMVSTKEVFAHSMGSSNAFADLGLPKVGKIN